jgi:DNA-binding XRE family transcriptional regulator
MDSGTATMTGSQGARCLGIVSGFVLKLARQSAELTQERLAAEFGVDVSTVQGWESGRRPLTALRTGELLRLRMFLARHRASAVVTRQLTAALEADFVLATAVGAGNRPVDPDRHPLAASVHRRALTNLITWPVTGDTPAALAPEVVGLPRRGPAQSYPALYSDERTRLFDHLLAIADRGTGDEHVLLRRQAVYLLGFDNRPATADWLRDDWQRTGRLTHAGLPRLLSARSASIALAARGDGAMLEHFVDGLTGDEPEAANLNYWAYWIGELAEDQTDDTFMLTTDPRSWGGVRLLQQLTDRVRPEAPQLPLNLHTLHSLIASRPTLLTDWPQLRPAVSAAVERTADGGRWTGRIRDQLAGLAYALRLARR